jgi:hypothetical protein
MRKSRFTDDQIIAILGFTSILRFYGDMFYGFNGHMIRNPRLPLA